MKRFVSRALISSVLATSLLGCSSGEVVRGVGAVALGTAVAVATIYAPPAQCRAGYREVCHSYVNFWGEVVRECTRAYDDCVRYEVAKLEDTESLTDVAAGIPLVNEDFAAEFGMSFAAANEFVAAMRRAADGDEGALTQYGFSSEDLELMGEFKLPSKQAIKSLAEKLNMMYESTEGMLNRMRAWGLQEKRRRDALGRRF